MLAIERDLKLHLDSLESLFKDKAKLRVQQFLEQVFDHRVRLWMGYDPYVRCDSMRVSYAGYEPKKIEAAAWFPPNDSLAYHIESVKDLYIQCIPQFVYNQIPKKERRYFDFHDFQLVYNELLNRFGDVRTHRLAFKEWLTLRNKRIDQLQLGTYHHERACELYEQEQSHL